MTRDEFLQKMIEKGKIDQTQVDKIKAKDDAKKKYKAEKGKLVKADMQAILDTLVG